MGTRYPGAGGFTPGAMQAAMARSHHDNQGHGRVEWWMRVDQDGSTGRNLESSNHATGSSTSSDLATKPDGTVVATTTAVFRNSDGSTTTVVAQGERHPDGTTSCSTTVSGAPLHVTGPLTDRQTITDGDSTVHVTTTVNAEGTLEQTVTSTDHHGGGTVSQHSVYSADGSYWRVDGTTTDTDAHGNTVTVSTSGGLDIDGSAASLTEVEVRDAHTGETRSEAWGVNSDGEDFHATGVTDALGHSETTIVTAHADDSYTVTTVDHDVDGSTTAESHDFDSDGDEIAPWDGDVSSVLADGVDDDRYPDDPDSEEHAAAEQHAYND
ncbi:hypothetical protein [Nocardia huaxiensis]|uniref:Uncharacterized protein n=1 Tax=Nocardia huaxiensis TaxID=2755382 RepID=A0A7D6ZFV3_9NOCA|nr:hypothetical protein [Nocardia huaxiensis]QLY29327.1 hypothetical protein H0264_29225 [Nocardia huaxiensis]UFS97196.1 hypothetical protein LPY97_04505 [Nocardia huaxiensis]